jgi:polyhydroxyalkanoate synthesis regulator phasin
MRNLAQSDPVLQDVMRQIDEVSDSVKNKSQQAMDVLATSRTVQVSSLVLSGR